MLELGLELELGSSSVVGGGVAAGYVMMVNLVIWVNGGSLGRLSVLLLLLLLLSVLSH